MDYEWELRNGSPSRASLSGRGRMPLPHCPGPTRQTVVGFARYHSAVRSLPLREQQTITAAARLIVRSFETGCKPILDVLLLGHADRDVQRGPAYERSISVERARAVRQALSVAVTGLGQRTRLAPGAPPLSAIRWQHAGIGAAQPANQHARTEQERARNRRVDIILSPGVEPLPAPRRPATHRR